VDAPLMIEMQQINGFPFSLYFLIHFNIRFFSGEGCRDSNPRRYRHALRSTAISDSSAGSTPRRAQAMLEM